MPTVNLRQARKHLRHWVTAAQACETIITRHGKPVAKLVSTEAESQSTWSAALLRHLDEGPSEGPPFEIDRSDLLPFPEHGIFD